MPDAISMIRSHYQSPGRCIYCQATGPNLILTDEHIIPFFMGGVTELDDCSCTECNKITSYIDGYCANHIFHAFRHRIGVQSRTKSKPTTLKVFFETAAGRVERVATFDDAPHLMVLPEFDPPGIITNTEYFDEKPEPQGYWHWMNGDFQARVEKLREPGDTGFEVQTGANWSTYCRFVAKTALAGAVAMFGYDSRLSFLPDIILGKNTKLRQFVGGAKPYAVAPLKNIPHLGPLEHHGLEFKTVSDGLSTYLIAEIQFFLEVGAPSYCVVIGPAPSGDLGMQLRAPSRRQ